MIPESFAVIGAVIGSIGGLFYLYETIVGTVKPNRASYFLWFLFPMITFVAQRAQGVEGLSWATFAAGFTPLLIVIASFLNKGAYWRTEPRDYVLMAAATVGIVLSVIASNPVIAIVFAVIADALAGVPTFVKAYRHPETESWIAYGISAFGFGLGVLAIPAFTFEHAAFITYVFVANLVLALFASRARTRPRPLLHTEL